jgi:glutamyl-tRNA(Gln) amidotransferase subunit D
MKPEAGDRVQVKKGSAVYEGVVMPSAGGTIVIKLDNGYNVGLSPDAEISLIEKQSKKSGSKKQKTAAGISTSLPKVSIMSTGGTIASKVDYRTGAVTSQFTAEDILTSIPELGEIASLKADVLYSILSENMRPEFWVEIAKRVAKEIENGADGVIVTHGTDTMGYTSAALSFMLDTPVPVVIVGSQRSADRPSSDATINAVCATKVATSDIAEVVVVMHSSTSDNSCFIHRGTRVRKMHTSRRDAFVSINEKPIGTVDFSTKKIEILSQYKKRGGSLKLSNWVEPKCALVKFYPSASPQIIDFYAGKGYKGIVIEGTGLGHVSSEWIDYIRKAVASDVHVVMTSQCLYGRVCDRVYDTGRDLLNAGVIEGEDMLPEVALVKLMWVLGKTNNAGDVKRVMQTNIAGEISGSSKDSFPGCIE